MSEFLGTLVNMSISGVLIAAVIMLLRIPLRKAPRRYSYMLWGILGIRLLCPFSLPSAASLFNLFETETDKVGITITAIVQTDAQTAAPHVTAQTSQAAAATDVWEILFPVWAAGAAALAVYNIFAYIRLRRRISGAVNLHENIWECGNIPTAFVMGIFRPRIYIPSGLSAKEREFIVAHERTHIRRLDYIIKPLAILALCIHWFNPLIWISFFMMVRDMEISCDERAVKGFDLEARKEYAGALLSMSVKQNRLPVGAALAFGESSIKQRIKSVLSPKKPALWISIAAVLVIIAAAVCLLTDASGKQDSPAPDSGVTSLRETGAASAEETHETAEATEPETADTPTDVTPVQLDEANAAQTVNAVLNSLTLTKNTDGSMTAMLAMPVEIPSDPEGKTKLYLTMSADYYLGEGTYSNERLLDMDDTLQPDERRSFDVLSSGDERQFRLIMLRAAFMTETEPGAYREYYADYVQLSEPNVQGSELAPSSVNLNSTAVHYYFSGDDFTITFGVLPELTLSEPDEENHTAGIQTIPVMKDGAQVGTLNIYPFGTDELSETDTAADKMPMQVFSTIALSSMMNYGEGYHVVSSTATSSNAVSYPESSGGAAAQCAFAYDYSKLSYFVMLTLDPGTLTDEQLEAVAGGIAIS